MQDNAIQSNLQQIWLKYNNQLKNSWKEGVNMQQLSIDTYKVRNPILWIYIGFYTMYYKDIREFQILYLQDICW
jgi:hypothetical protein